MASIMVQTPKISQPERIQGRLSAKEAQVLAASMARAWNGPVVEVFAYDYLLYRSEEDRLDGMVYASIYIEYFSPPSAQERGQPRRPENASR
jgi:hypothetical protein